MSWYVVYTQTGYEDKLCHMISSVKEDLFHNIEIKLLIPKRRMIERRQGSYYTIVRKMFPGYVLVNTDDIIEFYYGMKKLRGQGKVLRNADYFHQVPDKDIEHISSLLDDSGLADMSQVFVIGQRIEVISGPLYGYNGEIIKIDKRKRRARVKIKVDCNVHNVDLGIEVLKM